MERTKRYKTDGGDTAWEEKHKQSYATSEVTKKSSNSSASTAYSCAGSAYSSAGTACSSAGTAHSKCQIWVLAKQRMLKA